MVEASYLRSTSSLGWPCHILLARARELHAPLLLLARLVAGRRVVVVMGREGLAPLPGRATG